MARKKTRASRQPATPNLRNPTEVQHWHREPETLEELEQDWIPETRRLLLKWLQESEEEARKVSDADQHQQHKDAFDNEWTNWEQRASLDTGTLSIDDQASHDEAMRPLKDASKETESSLHTWHKHVEFQTAQAAWEDFLYYQNEWNRRSFVSGKHYYETMTDAKKARRNASKKAKSAKYLVHDDTLQLHDPYSDWVYALISRYEHFGLGHRDSIPAQVGPDFAHRYSQPPRGTIPWKHKDSIERHERLARRFLGISAPPGKHVLSSAGAGDIDKQNPTSGERDTADPSWTLDHAAFVLKKDKVDQKYLEHPETQRLLPEGHVLHHGVLESSFDWHTSFDAEEWGNIVAVTASRHIYIYEKEEFESSDGQKKWRYKRDKNNRRIRSTEACGYKKVKQAKKMKIFVHDLNKDGSVKGRKPDGTGWYGEEKRVDVQVDVNDPHYDHPEPNIRYRSKTEFKIIVIKAPASWQKLTRYQRHEETDRERNSVDCVDQLSDTEASDCIKSNVNFGRSGNMNGYPGTARRGSGTPGVDHIGSDDDSDDEEDFFTLSYLECSRPVCEGARTHLAEMKNEYGSANPGWTYRHVVALLDGGAGRFEVERIYRDTVKYGTAHEHSAVQLLDAARQLLALENEFGRSDWMVPDVAAALERNPDVEVLETQYRARVGELTAEATELLASLVERFGDLGMEQEGVMNNLCDRKTKDAIEDCYRQIANRRQDGSATDEQDLEQESSRDS